MIDRDWWRLAACKGMDVAVFFPPRGGDHRPANEVCARCPVSEECLLFALSEERSAADHKSHVYGIRGGASAKARIRMARESRQRIAS